MSPFDSQPHRLIHLSAEGCAKALARTANTVKNLDEIRRRHELPPEALGLIIAIYEGHAHSVFVEEAAPISSRMPMKIGSCDELGRPIKVVPKAMAKIITRPQWCAYRVEDIEIQGDRSRWLVHDIEVGNHSQILGRRTRGPIKGTELGPDGMLRQMRLETCQTAMDFTLTVEYVGPEPDGEAFDATAIGTAAV
jgi:hypothetical protein